MVMIVAVRVGANNSASGPKRSTLRWGEEVDLVLYREHARIGRHQAECRIAARAVCDRSHDARVQEAMLLSEVCAERQGNLGLARAEPREAGFEELHDPLLGKAGPNPVGEVGVLRGEDGHR